MASYQVHRFSESIDTSDGNAVTPRVIPKAPAGSRLIAFTLMKYSSAYDDTAGDCTIGVCIGGTDVPPVRIVRNMTWTAPLNPATGAPVPETGGLFIAAMPGEASVDVDAITGFEFYLEFAPQGAG